MRFVGTSNVIRRDYNLKRSLLSIGESQVLYSFYIPKQQILNVKYSIRISGNSSSSSVNLKRGIAEAEGSDGKRRKL